MKSCGQEIPSFSSLKHTTQLISGLCWSPFDSALLLSASCDFTAQIWNVKTGKAVLNLRGHNGRVFGACWSRLHPNIVYTGSDDQTCRMWNIDEQPNHSCPPCAKDVRKQRQLLKAKDGLKSNSKGNDAVDKPVAEKGPPASPAVAPSPLPTRTSNTDKFRKRPFFNPSVLNSSSTKQEYAACVAVARQFHGPAMTDGAQLSLSLIDSCFFGEEGQHLFHSSDLSCAHSSHRNGNYFFFPDMITFLQSPDAISQLPSKEAGLARENFDVWEGNIGGLLQSTSDDAPMFTNCRHYLKLRCATLGMINHRPPSPYTAHPLFITERIASGAITSQIVALSAAAGRDVWEQMSQLYAKQLASEGTGRTLPFFHRFD